MTALNERLNQLTDVRLEGMRRGIEKESLRAQANGHLALTPHPAALGSALTHPHITTDYSESLVELITGVHRHPAECLAEMSALHSACDAALTAENLWAGSMPCILPQADADIPLGQYGSSNIGRLKTIYRMGLGWRYGRKMQTIAGIHYNWSMPGIDNVGYFNLIRNFRRHSFLLLVLFGASPAVCKSFVAGRAHGLQPLGEHSMHLPHATSLRMGRLGYQSEAQASLQVSYNCLDSYAASLHGAMTQPYAPYEAIGLQGPDGQYRQLNTTLLQIENEFYGTIRPKRVIRRGERPLHALRERGVEYVEVRCMDLDPFEPLGIARGTLHFLDIFLLHCLLADSPPDTPQEMAELSENQHLAAARGREPGLALTRHGQAITLTDWASELIDGMEPIAKRLDTLHRTEAHQQAMAKAKEDLHQMEQLPSARCLAEMKQNYDNNFLDFTLARSALGRSQRTSAGQDKRSQDLLQEQARTSLLEQARIEAEDQMSFEAYRRQYLATERLVPGPLPAAAM
jgi:glutamate--cysteine ligase